MNITKEQLALKFHETYERLAPQFGYETRSDTKTFDPESNNGRLMIAVCESIMRGLAEDTELLALFAASQKQLPLNAAISATSPQAAQTAIQSESSAQAAQALARLPSEGKPIEALAPTEAALREVVRLSEDAGLYDDFQTEAQERPAYPEGDVVGLCVCGSWSGGRCLRCEWRAGSKP